MSTLLWTFVAIIKYFSIVTTLYILEACQINKVFIYLTVSKTLTPRGGGGEEGVL